MRLIVMKKLHIILFVFITAVLTSFFACSDDSTKIYTSEYIEPFAEIDSDGNKLESISTIHANDGRLLAGIYTHVELIQVASFHSYESKSVAGLKTYDPNTGNVASVDLSSCNISDILNICKCPDDGYVLLHYKTDTNSQTNSTYKELIKTDANGSIVASIRADFDEDKDEINGESVLPSINDIASDSSGDIFILFSDKLGLLSKDLTVKFTLELPDGVLENHGLSLLENDGEILLCAYLPDVDSSGYMIYAVDKEKQCWCEIPELPQTDKIAVGVIDDSVYVSDDIGLREYSGEDARLLFAWSDLGIAKDDIADIIVTKKSDIFVSLNRDDGIEIVRIYETDAKQNAVEIITLAYEEDITDSRFSFVMSCVAGYNKQHPERQIKLAAYKSDEKQSAAQKIANDIIAGRGPDLVLLTNSGSYELLQSHGIFADLYEYIDNDENYSRDAFLPCVLEPFESGDRLNALTTDYYLLSLSADTSFIGEDWTLDDLIELSSSLDDDQYLISVSTTEGNESTALLERLLPGVITEFVDYKSKSCDFGASFERLLELCRDARIYNCPTGFCDPALTRSRKLILNSGIYGSLVSMIAFNSLYIDDSFEYIGYPGTDSPAVIVPSLQFAIVASSENRHNAWDFISYYLDMQTESWREVASSLDFLAKMYFPCTDAALDAMFDLTEKYYVTVNGYYAADPESGGEVYQIMYMAHEIDGKLPPEACIFDSDDESELRGLIDSATATYNQDDAILSIISEEAATYFAGAKPLDEVISIIENRVTTVINE